jgi:hypothetical protein
VGDGGGGGNYADFGWIRWVGEGDIVTLPNNMGQDRPFFQYQNQLYFLFFLTDIIERYSLTRLVRSGLLKVKLHRYEIQSIYVSH